MASLQQFAQQLWQSKSESEAYQLLTEFAGALSNGGTVSKPLGEYRKKAGARSQLLQEPLTLLHRQLMVQGPQLGEQLCEPMNLACTLFEHRCRDTLTGLPTYAQFRQGLALELAQSEVQLSILQLDCDNFRDYAWTHGHEAGDQLLQCVALFLQEQVEPTGVVYRRNADEFVIKLSSQKKAEACQVAEALCEEFQKRFSFSTGCTASIGVAHLPDDARTLKGILKAVDEALYLAKRRGRNHVAVSQTYEQRHRRPVVREVLQRT